MATIKDGVTSTQLAVDATSKAARVSLYDPATGLPMASYIRGTGFDLDTSANVDMRDAIAIAVPGSGGAQIAGTSVVPLRTDPTGTTTQPVSGTVAVSNHPATQAVTGTVTVANPVNAVQVNNFPATQSIVGTVTASGSVAITNFPGTQQVVGSVSIANLPSTQPVSGTVNATVQAAGANVSASNPLPVTTVGAVNITNDSGSPVPVTVVPAEPGIGFSAIFDITPSTLADGTTYWTFRNAGTKTVYIQRAEFQQGYYGTNSGNARTAFSVFRFTGTPTGGASVAPVRKMTGTAASGMSILTAAAGLTTSALTWDTGAVHRVANVNSVYNFALSTLVYGTSEAEQLQLAPGEGIAIRATGAIISGSFLTGYINWRER